MKTIVMLPGMMCDERLFAPQIAHLNERYYVKIMSIHEHANMADSAKNVLAQSPDEFALLGLSMGGILAMEIMDQAPQRITHLALLDTNPRAELDVVKQRRGPQIERVKNGGLSQIMRDEMKPNYLVDSPNKLDILKLCMVMAEDLGDQAFINQSNALRDRPDYQNVLKGVDVPTLIMCGREDVLCPIERHELMHELIGGSVLHIVDNAGHLPTLEQPEIVNKALDQWLENNR
ncbi:MAG: alpha/beta hydrolase [Lentilitoribacter sp.]